MSALLSLPILGGGNNPFATNGLIPSAVLHAIDREIQNANVPLPRFSCSSYEEKKNLGVARVKELRSFSSKRRKESDTY
jgi:hypothetical protein